MVREAKTYIELEIHVKLMIEDMYKSHTKAHNKSQMTKRMSACRSLDISPRRTDSRNFSNSYEERGIFV